MSHTSLPDPAAARLHGLRMPSGLVWSLPVLAMVLAVSLQAGAFLNSDTSWILTLVEKMLAGQRFGADFIEVNPPFTIWLYFPPVVAARLLGLQAEAMIDVYIFALAGASVFVCGRMLRVLCLLDAAKTAIFAAAVIAILCILPGSTFAQRDHIAAIAILPWLAAAILRASGVAPRWDGICAASLGAAVTLAVKPQFAIVLASTAIAASLLRRDWRLIFSVENLLGGSTAALLMAAALWLHPDYWRETVPLVRDMYVGGVDWSKVASRPMVWMWFAASLAVVATSGRRFLQPEYMLTWIASAGFLAVFVMQGKLFPYQSLPMLSLVFILAIFAALSFCARQKTDESFTSFVLKPAILVCLVAILFPKLAFGHFASPGDWSALARAIDSVAKKPVILGLSVDLGVGHPVTRMTGGTWLGAYASMWVALSAAEQRAGNPEAGARARIDAFDRAHLERVKRELIAGKPDILLFDRFGGFDAFAYLKQDKEIAAALGRYERASVVPVSRAGEEVEIWLRDDYSPHTAGR